MRYAIVDDEPISHRIIEGYAQGLPFLVFAGSCYNALEALELLRRDPVDLLFLDIQLPKLSGFELLRTLVRPPLVIAVTAFREYALEGYELAICDYLLKPFSLERFLRAVNKAQAQSQNSASASDELGTLFFKDGKKFHQVQLQDLVYIEACANYCLIHLREGRIMTQEKISDLAARLPQVLLRIHKSYLVPINKIQTISADSVRIGAHQLPVGRAYKGNLAKVITGQTQPP